MINVPDSKFVNTIDGTVKVRSAEDWVTPEEDAADPFIEALNEYVIIRPLGVKKETAGGLILPEVVRNNALQLMTVGRIVSVGDHAGKRPGVSSFERGQYVLYPKNGSYLFEYKGVKLVILNDDAILARVSESDLQTSDGYIPLKAGATGKEIKTGK